MVTAADGTNAAPLRALELFCGIGGFAAALERAHVQVVGAFDQDPLALSVYRSNFPGHPLRMADLERVNAWELTVACADLWWLSPPCQPYCERGGRRDLDDRRAQSLVHLLGILSNIPEARLPRHLALENVAGFVGSQAHDRLLTLLAERGYYLREHMLCPTELGIPSRRPRYYLAASRLPLAPASPLPVPPARPLAGYLAPLLPDELPAGLRVTDDILERFGSGLRILDPADRSAYTTCFTSGYGRSLMHSGSYLACGNAVRRFLPEEIARLLHFPAGFSFIEGMSLRQKWHLVGNSLSVVAVREVVRAFPEVRWNDPQTNPPSPH